MSAYYNEYDADKAEWLRELMKAGVIAQGEVDERSIEDVEPADLRGFRRVHLFAGIGIWDFAARNAGIRDDEELWTASCPCPPFSVAGKQKFCPSCNSSDLVPHVGRTGFFVCVLCDHEWFGDARHLWPEVWRLQRDRRPGLLYGEQVASGDGRTWFSSVRASLEILGYAVRGFDLCSAGVGATDIRQRLYFVADLLRDGYGRLDEPRQDRRSQDQDEGTAQRTNRKRLRSEPCRGDSANAVTQGDGHGGRREESREQRKPLSDVSQRGSQGPVTQGDGIESGCETQREFQGSAIDRETQLSSSTDTYPVAQGDGIDDGHDEIEQSREPQNEGRMLESQGSNNSSSVGQADGERVRQSQSGSEQISDSRGETRRHALRDSGENGAVAHGDGRKSGNRELQRSGKHGQQPQDGCDDASDLEYAERRGHGEPQEYPSIESGDRPQGRLSDRASESSTGNAVVLDDGSGIGRGGSIVETRQGSGNGRGEVPIEGTGLDGFAGYTNGFWRDAVWIRCLDTDEQGNNKYRAVASAESLSFEVDAGLAADLGLVRYEGETVFWPTLEKTPNRNMRIRGYGDAINARLAIEFIKATRGNG